MSESKTHARWNPVADKTASVTLSPGQGPTFIAEIDTRNHAPDPLAKLRAAVTEAEAAVGRECLNGDSAIARSSDAYQGWQEAVAALRKAEEEAKRPRLASVGQLQSEAASARDRDDALVQATRGDMMAAIRALPRYSCRDTVLPAVLLSDIEALVQEAGR